MASLRNLKYLHPRSLKHMSHYLSGLVEGRLWLKVILAMIIGLAVGSMLGPSAGLVLPATSEWISSWLAFPGQLFLAVIQMLVVPLVLASIILGLASSDDSAQLKKLGTWATGFFAITTVISAALGLILASVLRPGAALAGKIETPTHSAAIEASGMPTLTEIPQIALNLLPGNPLGSMVEGQMLQVVLFAVIVGIALVSLPAQQARPLLDFLSSVQQVCMIIVRWAMRLAPIAVFGLMARLASQLGVTAIIGMLQYVGVVLLGLALLLGLYLVIVRVMARRSPLEFLKQTRELLLLAFSTSSSAAVMPLSIRTAQEQLSISKSVAQFVIPLGATINMNGTALYQSVAAVFLAQVYGIDVSMGGLAFIVAMAVGASIGSPATPGVGIVILATTVATIGVPAEGIALILGVDRILDMSRTAVNVAGDVVACTVVERFVGGKARTAKSVENRATSTTS